VAKAWDLDRFEAHAADTFPLGRLGQPSEIVGPMLVFASDAGRFTTGALLAVDGGVRAASTFWEDE
jgi:NAD(P)-dependent dehydrogenase (short-subunit alcohol dehydrogenase family)